MSAEEKPAAPLLLGYSLREAGQLFRPSAERAVRNAARNGELKTIMLGSRKFVTRLAIEQWLSTK